MNAFHIPTPPGFRFRPTVFSHGWYELPPFRYHHAARVLERVHRFDDGSMARVVVTEGDNPATLYVEVEGPARLTAARKDEVIRMLATVLNLEQDLLPFYRLARKNPDYRWVATMGAGRLLVSPTVWEDAAKTLLTTNTTWMGTVRMCERLVTLGDRFGEHGHCFPTPAQVAALSVDDLDAHVRAGYRSAYLHELATAVADGRLDLETWRDPRLPGDELFKQIKRIKGFGDYAAGSMCRLLARFDRLGLDSACRSWYREQVNGGESATDREIAAYYASFGDWCGLAVWMDVMQDHLTRHAGAKPRPVG